MTMNGIALDDYILEAATLPQTIESWRRHHEVWGKTLTRDDYLVRETLLSQQALTRDGGVTTWVLVPRGDTKTLDFACSVDATRRQATLVHKDKGEGQRERQHVVSYAMGSVFTPREKRGKGYALRMMTLLHDKLRRAKTDEDETVGEARCQDAHFSILYSDIGKSFYSKAGIGWHVISPFEAVLKVPQDRVSRQEDIKPMTKSAALQFLASLTEEFTDGVDPSVGGTTTILIDPRPELFDLQFRRSEFYVAIHGYDFARENQQLFGFQDKARNTIIFTLSFKDRALQVLFIHTGVSKCPRSPDDRSQAEAKLLHETVAYAQEVQSRGIPIDHVVAWNVQRATLDILDVQASEMRDSMPALAWYGDASVRLDDIEWVYNEKYAWC